MGRRRTVWHREERMAGRISRITEWNTLSRYICNWAGDPSSRVFSQINPEEFNKSFLSWVKGICKITAGEIIAFDGKQSRNSGDEKTDRGVINTVTAWAESNRLVLGQTKVEGKSNEITALPELINV
jgi:hypothetical protein